jgi:hypothetical protein
MKFHETPLYPASSENLLGAACSVSDGEEAAL